MLKKNQICIGRKPIEEALSSGKNIEKIFMQRGSKGSSIGEIQQLAANAQVPISYVPKEKLLRFTNLRHQGVVAILSEIEYFKIEDIVDHCYSEGRDPFILILDGVTDVGNFGAICRSALGFNVDGVVIGQSNAAPVNYTAIKASAGAIHHLKICRQKSVLESVQYLKNAGVAVISLHGKGDSMIGALDLSGPIAIVMGDEGAGVSKAMLKLSDKICKIPMNPQLESYNVSVATAIMLYEVDKGRVEK